MELKCQYFDTIYQQLRTKYDEVYLIRNERQLAIYSFEDGSRFEPDFVLFLRKKGEPKGKQYQLFVEPKGGHLLEKDAWKESFLKLIAEQAIPVKRFADDNEYRIIGLPFYNHQSREHEFVAALQAVLR